MSAPRYLLDTHIMLWDLVDDPRISSAHDRILLGDAPKFISIASLWEIAIKAGIGKLAMPERLLETITKATCNCCR